MMLIDLNTASTYELERLPGIGFVTVAEIVRSRPFTHLVQLLKVKGIGDKNYAVLTGTSPRVCIGSSVSTSLSDDKKNCKDHDATSERRAARLSAGRPRTETRTASVSSSRGLVDLNTASLRELQAFDGIGRTKAAKTVQARPFSRKEELLDVNGAVTYHKLQRLAVVSPLRWVLGVWAPTGQQHSGAVHKDMEPPMKITAAATWSHSISR